MTAPHPPGSDASPGRPRHDAAYRSMFAAARAVADLLRLRGADWIAGHRFDPDTLDRAPDTFVTRALRRRRADMVWRIRAPDGRAGYVLIEFQSTVDPDMPARVAGYGTRLRRRAPPLDRGPGGEPPPVLAVVVYNGGRPWSAPTDVEGVMGSAPSGGLGARPRALYHVVDLRALDPDAAPRDNAVAWMARLERARSWPEAMAVWSETRPALERDGEEELAEAFAAWIVGLLAARHDVDGRALWHRIRPREGENMRTLLERARQWGHDLNREWLERGRTEGIAQGRTEGIAEGRTEGIAQGRAEQAALLGDLAETRFGPQAAAAVSEALGDRSDPAVIARVARLLMAAASADDLLARLADRRDADNGEVGGDARPPTAAAVDDHR